MPKERSCDTGNRAKSIQTKNKIECLYGEPAKSSAPRACPQSAQSCPELPTERPELPTERPERPQSAQSPSFYLKIERLCPAKEGCSLQPHTRTDEDKDKMNQTQSKMNKTETPYATRVWRGDTSTSGSSVPKFGTYGAAKESNAIKRLLDERDDRLRFPERYTTNYAEAVAIICELENTIVRQGGKAELDKVIAAEEAEEEEAARAERAAAAKKAAVACRLACRSAAAARAEASKSTDPIMSVHEYLTLPKSQSETFLSLWVQRQADTGRAATQAQGLRFKAALAVADKSEQNHPAESHCDESCDGDYYPELNAGVAGGEPTSDPHITVKEVSLTADATGLLEKILADAGLN